MAKHFYGWKRDLPDQKDFLFLIDKTVKIPIQVDLRPSCPAVYDQGQLGACVSNAVAGAMEYDATKEQLSTANTMPSRLFIYYNGRVIEGTVNSDSGLTIRDGMKSVAQYGECMAPSWPYIIANFEKKPTAKCYTEAKAHLPTVYSSVAQNLTTMKSCLASGYPIVIGISVYDSFESDSVAKTGIVPLPKKNESILGGHALLIVGYDDSKSWFIVRNSWGANWGVKGYCFMPYNYLTNKNLASDFWTVKTVS